MRFREIRRRVVLASRLGAALGLAVLAAVAGCAKPTASRTPASPRGAVSSAHPLVTAAGVEILEAGGNAFDAAVAVAAALNVVEPMMSGVGGYGTILVYDASAGRVRFLNSSSRIPAGVDSDAFRAPTPGYRESRRGAKAVSTPANVNAWELMWKEYGTLEWRTLLEPAIRLARDGFEVSPRLAGNLSRAFEDFPPHAREIYGREGRPLDAGRRLVQAQLADSLESIAERGAEAMRSGPLAQAIDRTMTEAGGFLRLSDLQDNAAEWWEPISIPYRGTTVYTASPPSTAFPSLIRLGLMSRYDVTSLGHNSAAMLHRFAEATKHAFWCRLAYAGDPDVESPPLDRLLSEAYWTSTAAEFDLQQASVFSPPTPEDFGAGRPDGHTTHYVVADGKGNVVSATQTLGNAFGSRIMPEGTGIWLNNSLAYCTFEPKGNPMDAHAGRHKLSGDCPTFVFREGRLRAALGTPGGHTIGQTVPQMVMNLVDFGMGVADAIGAARISFVEPDLLAVEEGIDESVRRALEQMGHRVRVTRALGNAHAISISYDRAGGVTGFEGAADPRGEGSAEVVY